MIKKIKVTKSKKFKKNKKKNPKKEHVYTSELDRIYLTKDKERIGAVKKITRDNQFFYMTVYTLLFAMKTEKPIIGKTLPDYYKNMFVHSYKSNNAIDKTFDYLKTENKK